MRYCTLGFIAALIATSSVPATAQEVPAQGAPYFGEDGSEFSHDGECDDVRFVGEGMADHLLTDSIGKDASDCRAAFNAGTVVPNPLFAEPAEPGAYLYGDDASEFALDGECDDIRFGGDQSHDMYYLDEDIGHDASDCRAQMAAGTVHWQANDHDIILGLSVED